jgi:hypothetical protein
VIEQLTTWQRFLQNKLLNIGLASLPQFASTEHGNNHVSVTLLSQRVFTRS